MTDAHQRLEPGWLERDVRKASARWDQWHGREAMTDDELAATLGLEPSGDIIGVMCAACGEERAPKGFLCTDCFFGWYGGCDNPTNPESVAAYGRARRAKRLAAEGTKP